MNDIKIVNIKKSFQSGQSTIEVLHNINWQIHSGKMTFLVGPSGCGKTTLISIIAGILSPTSGDIFVFQENINKMSSRNNSDFRKRNIGFIFQQFNLLPSLTAQENISIPLIINKINPSLIRKKSHEMLAKVGLENYADKLPRELSGGQQQRVAIARALIHEPRLLVCDEPTASLDAHSGIQVMDLLKEHAKDSSRCVVIVTHDDRIFKYADIMARMNDGRINEE